MNKDNKIKHFLWEGYNENGGKVQGLISSYNLPMAKMKLYRETINVTRIYQQSRLKSIFSYRAIKKDKIVAFSQQLATLTIAGIPLIKSLALLANRSNDKYFSNLINKIKKRVEHGASISEALQQYPKYFDTLFCNLVAAGEQSGTLDVLLESIANYQEKNQLLKKKLRKALSYPVIVMIIASMVTTLLLVKVIPEFERLFQSNGKQLPIFTNFILQIANFLQKYGIGLLLLLFILFSSYIMISQYSFKFRIIIDRLTLKLVIFGPLLKKAAIARFCRTLATTYAAGMPILDALTLAAKASNNLFFQQTTDKIRDDIATGEQFNYAMKKTAIFPTIAVQMIAIGEESGNLDSMLYKAAQMYEQEIELAIDNLGNLLEPIIMSILGIIIGSIVIAMYLPIFNMGKVF